MENKILAVHGIQTNMLNCMINPFHTNECLILLNTGKTLIIKCEKDSQANEIFIALNTSFIFESKKINALKLDFDFVLEII